MLLKNDCYAGAYYLMGYAVECALKACIARQVKEHDFPDKKVVNDSYTHDLEKLLNVSELKNELEKETRANATLQKNWAVVKEWSEESRYDLNFTKADARDFCEACTDCQNGVLTWLKKQW